MMTKNIIALLGSGLPDGNTSKLLKEAIRGAEDAGCTVEQINMVDAHITPCMQTYGCMFENKCMIEDGAEKYLNKLKRCDGLIIATPTMNYGIPGALKSFFDRCQPFYMAKYYRKQPFVTKEHAKIRKALFICIAGMNADDVFTGSVLTTKAFCSITDFKYADELLQNDMDSIQKIENKPEVLKAAYEKGFALGKSICDARE